MERWRWVAAAALLAGCSIESQVTRLGDETYATPLQARPLTSARKIQGRATEVADNYCAERARDARVIGTDATKITFTCAVRLTFEDRMNAAVRALLDENVRAAISRLGYPVSREILGETVYEWHEEHYDPVAMPTVSGTWGIGGAGIFSAATTGSTYVSVQAACSIQLATTADGTVEGAHWSGNERGCAPYLQALGTP